MAQTTAPEPDVYGGPPDAAWRSIDWREHLRWVRIRGKRVNVMEMGSGPPLLLIHGHSGCWQNWLENIPHFAERYRVVAPDLPGFGHSEMPDEPITIESYARFIGELCDELEIERAPIVGNSLGGFVGAEVCLKFPDRSSRLVLVAAAGLANKYMGIPNQILRNKAVEAFARAVNSYARIPDARLETMVRRPRLRLAVLAMVAAHPDQLSPAMAAEMLQGSGRPAAPQATSALLNYDFRDRLDDVRCPTLIIWGERDRTVPVDGADEYERLIPNSRKVILEDTGHVPMLERPARFNQLVDEFLAEDANAPGGYPVTAPADADDTSRAYLAITPDS